MCPTMRYRWLCSILRITSIELTDNGVVKYFMASIHRHNQKQSNVTTHTHRGIDRESETDCNQYKWNTVAFFATNAQPNAIQRENDTKGEEQTWYKYEHFIVAESYINEQNIIYYVRNNDTLLFYASFYFQPQLNIWWPFYPYCLISWLIHM